MRKLNINWRTTNLLKIGEGVLPQNWYIIRGNQVVAKFRKSQKTWVLFTSFYAKLFSSLTELLFFSEKEFAL